MCEHAISPGKGSVTAGTQTFVPVCSALWLAFVD